VVERTAKPVRKRINTQEKSPWVLRIGAGKALFQNYGQFSVHLIPPFE